MHRCLCSAILNLVPVDIENVNVMCSMSAMCITADSCDCEEFGLPLAKRIHGLNLLQTKVFFSSSESQYLTLMCFPLIQGDCRTGGSDESEKGKEQASSGSSGGTMEAFSTVYPFPQGTG